MQRNNGKHSQSRAQKKAASHRPLRQRDLLQQNKQPMAVQERFKYQQPALEIKPGAVSTVFMLGLLGNVVLHAAAEVTPAKQSETTSKGNVELANIVANHRNGDFVSKATCAEALDIFEKTAALMPDRLPHIIKMLKNINAIWCAEPSRFHETDEGITIDYQLNLLLSTQGTNPIALLSRLKMMQNYLLHSSKRCFEGNRNDAILPFFPATRAALKEYNAALDAGDARIAKFRSLLNIFRKQDVRQELNATYENSSIQHSLAAIKKLVYQHRNKNKLMTNEELDLFERYLVLSKGCLSNTFCQTIDDKTYHERYGNHDGIVYDPELDTHLIHHSTTRTDNKINVKVKYLHIFDSIANLVSDVAHKLRVHHSGESEFLQTLLRECYTIRSLSEAFIQAVYPELAALTAREEAKCGEVRNVRFKDEL